MMRRRHLFASTALALPLAFAPLSAQAADIMETLQNAGQFSTFADALEKAGLGQTLQSEGPYTVFAPTNEAFQKMSQPSGQQQPQAQASSDQASQTQASGSQSGQQQQQAGARQQGSDGQSQFVQQLDSQQLEQVLSYHIIEGQEILADELVGKEQKVSTLSGDELTVDGTGTTLLVVPTGLTVARVGDEVFVRREVAAAAVPAVTVSPATGEQGQQSGSGQQQQAAAQSGSGQQGQQSGMGEQDQQQAAAQSGGQGQSGQQDQPIGQQQGMLRAAMVVEPAIQADNGVIHAIHQVIVPERIEQQLMGGNGQQR